MSRTVSIDGIGEVFLNDRQEAAYQEWVAGITQEIDGDFIEEKILWGGYWDEITAAYVDDGRYYELGLCKYGRTGDYVGDLTQIHNSWDDCDCDRCQATEDDGRELSAEEGRALHS